ncbi:hypothetical protein [Hyphococcus sp.]|jgi:hypothetical protein|uniref:hypothetical protein n=1 Tax=Hyphococcus sp. TaxID=2038636 RepID=UPI003D0C1DDF
MLAGCESGDLARFAPPGIVKYEDLAGDQPVNPNVARRIEERREEEGAGKFPRLAETPDEGDRPEKKPRKELAAEKAALVDARETLAEEVAADRAGAEAELNRDLTAESDELKTRIDADSAAAARERRDKLVPAEQHPDREQ